MLPGETSESTPTRASGPLLNAGLALTALLSAWLLFQVQPMVGKRILPWFGGSSAVWTTAMLFFQSMLLAGYAYAHWVVTRLPRRRQAWLHGTLLTGAVVLAWLVPVVPIDVWKPTGSDYPSIRIVCVLLACVGLPYLMLASTAPLVQAWFTRVNPGRSPYRLYALSNLGSLAALVSYPFAVEPNLTLTRQGVAWSALFAAFAACCGACAALCNRATAAAKDSVASRLDPDGAVAHRNRTRYFFWLALPACASSLMLSVTTHLSSDVAPMPLLWIAPMVVYLLSFILTFDSDRWYRRAVWLPTAGATSLLAAISWHEANTWTIGSQIAVNLAMLWAMSMICHGELVRLRPAASHLTAFYMCVAAGGALGGLLNSVVAPLALPGFYELHVGVLAAWVIATALLATDPRSPFYDGGKGKAFVGFASIVVLIIVLAVTMVLGVEWGRRGVIAAARNFYGLLRVREVELEEVGDSFYKLIHGRITHGAQFRSLESRRVPMTYYHPGSGVGKLLADRVLNNSDSPTRRVGVVGLGAGTLAAYAENGDAYRFYEINSAVTQFANDYFSYLGDARQRGAAVEVVTGDGRLSLERESPQQFDLLVLDAFSGDAIPMHLLTLEAFEQYVKHLRQPEGILAVHVSNLHLALGAVVQAAADRCGLEAVQVSSGEDAPGAFVAEWILLCRRPGYFAERQLGVPLRQALKGHEPLLWTDDYSNVVQILHAAAPPPESAGQP